MGWCGGGTNIFDTMAEFILKSSVSDDEKVAILTKLAVALEMEDWDCQHDSGYWDHPLVYKVFKDLYGWE